jgi:hypothetical protein
MDRRAQTIRNGFKCVHVAGYAMCKQDRLAEADMRQLQRSALYLDCLVRVL